MPELSLRGGEVDGLSLHYVVAGRGPAVVLLHGLGGFAESWRGTIDRLASRATVFALDLPGFGRSAKPRTTYSLTYFARAVHGFLDAMGIAQASLVGHSLGAAVGVTYALTHPARSSGSLSWRVWSRGSHSGPLAPPADPAAGDR
jgi:pimeloyl-ACP methyl ester carboxylesterase